MTNEIWKEGDFRISLFLNPFRNLFLITICNLIQTALIIRQKPLILYLQVALSLRVIGEESPDTIEQHSG